jgi:hypothetical protein
MALNKCKDRDAQVSRNAKAFPHCGSKAFNAVNQISQGLLGCLCFIAAGISHPAIERPAHCWLFQTGFL